jgi:sugar phosphate isomerase/epimerase
VSAAAQAWLAGPRKGRAAAPLPDLSRVSLNLITAEQLSLAEAAAACARAGVPWIGPWRHKLTDGAESAARVVREAGLRVSSLCRGGFFPAADGAGRRERDGDNRRAVDEAAALGTEVLVLVCGPAPGGDLRAARRMVLEGIERLVPHAAERGVRLGIEPFHPMMIAERSVVVTLAQANDLAERFDPAHVGVVVDAYHVWWDPDLERQVARAGGRIVGYHVSDWLSPTPDVLAGRGMMGDGVIHLRSLRRLVEEAGYDGPIEVEVINPALATLPGDELVALVCERYLSCV